MYSTHNKEKSADAERFIRILENKICKYMSSISKSVYIDKLVDIVNKYNNTYHKRIKMRPADTKVNAYIKSSKKVNDEDLKFKIGGIVKKLKC